jgi:hypothetical protein
LTSSQENALEEVRTLLEQAERGHYTIEQELSDTNETLSDQICTNQAIEVARRNLEQEMQALNFRECRLGKSIQCTQPDRGGTPAPSPP